MTMTIVPYKSGGIKAGFQSWVEEAPLLSLLPPAADCWYRYCLLFVAASAAAAASTPRARPLRNL